MLWYTHDAMLVEQIESVLMVIKPSGIDYGRMRPKDMAVVDLISGEKENGDHHLMLKHVWNYIANT